MALNVVLSVGTGIIVGFSLALLLFQAGEFTQKSKIPDPRPFPSFPLSDYVPSQPIKGISEAESLFHKVRVLCWVMTGPENHQSKGQMIKETWGSRCNKLVFMSSVADTELGAIALPNVTEGRSGLWGKTKEAFRYIWRMYREQAEWFLKVDDDTFVIMENLRHFLSDKNPAEPVHYGYRLKFNNYDVPDGVEQQGYMSGGAGYVVSKEGVRIFVDEALHVKNKSRCAVTDIGSEDFEMGRCLAHFGVKAGDSRDEFGKERFYPLSPNHHMKPGNWGIPDWIFNRSFSTVKSGLDCCSESAISFHYVNPDQMMVLYQMMYKIRPYGTGCHIM